MKIEEKKIWKNGKYTAWIERIAGVDHLAVKEGQRNPIYFTTEMFEFIKSVWDIVGDKVGHDRK